MSKRKAKLLLTERALSDIREIEAFSVERWDKKTAARYISDIEAALTRIQDKPDLLRTEENLSPHVHFYRVNKHLLVCDRLASSIIVLTVIHASRDIPNRLAELLPTLSTEVELLHRQLEQKKQR